ncbi:MAG: hypothetical protein JXR95_10745 [Deltaproteobacteria bacterium]|nr:hypothetical protein [Deltaproteobacteria bacterium]
MANLPRDEKFHKVLKFLISFHNPKVVALMGARGFDHDSLSEGWNLLRQAADWMFEIKQLDSTSFAVKSDTVALLDRWENTWFDVADAALARLYPDVHRKLFSGISRGSGFGVVKNIQTLVGRLEELEADQTQDAINALAILEKRGLTQSERDTIKHILEDVTLEKMSEEFLIEPDEIEKRKKHEEEVWAWYLDWSKTARTVVANEKLRGLMGINEVFEDSSKENRTQDENDDFLTFLD